MEFIWTLIRYAGRPERSRSRRVEAPFHRHSHSTFAKEGQQDKGPEISKIPPITDLIPQNIGIRSIVLNTSIHLKWILSQHEGSMVRYSGYFGGPGQDSVSRTSTVRRPIPKFGGSVHGAPNFLVPARFVHVSGSITCRSTLCKWACTLTPQLDSPSRSASSRAPACSTRVPADRTGQACPRAWQWGLVQACHHRRQA